ncbi:MAG: hypothetical protein R2852_03995 [Bacteroidia bacterium]
MSEKSFSLSAEMRIFAYKFLNDAISLSEFEAFIYQNTPTDENFDDEKHFELLNFNYKDKYAQESLKQLLLKNYVSLSEFETWKLKTLLTQFINDIPNLKTYLDQFYTLYCGTLLENGERHYAYKFLGNLGLNAMYWLEEDYLKQQYGTKWQEEYNKAILKLDTYHKQLKPFAEELLKALNNNQIQILDNGTYTIADDLREKYEGNVSYSLKHEVL